MSRESVLARGRRAAEAGFVDTCTIRRITGATSDPDTGDETPSYADLYTGKCRVQQAVGQAEDQDVGEDRVQLLSLEVQLPMSVVGLEVGDEITVTASVHDADLVDRVFRVHTLAHKTHATARRVQCIERTGS